MVSYNEETLDITVDVVILPGFFEGLSRRGAWFAHTLETRSLLRKFRPGKNYVLRYLVHEPDSENPLSDGEIDHLLTEITASLDRYRSTLERLEMQFKDVRKRGKLNAFIYLLGILTVRWYWWIFLTRGEMSFNNSRNAASLEKARNTRNVVSRFWERGGDLAVTGVLNSTISLYEELAGDPLGKYREIRNTALERCGEGGRYNGTSEAWMKVARGYRAIIKRLTGRSLVTKMLPTTFWERLIFFFQRSYHIPEPDCVYPVRNLGLDIMSQSGELRSRGGITGRNRVEGNVLEIYALASKEGPPVCIPTKQALHISEVLSRSENIRRMDLNLEVVLHVGTEEERMSLLGIGEEESLAQGKKTALLSRIQNAALDTHRRDEALIGYQLKEQLPVLFRNFKVRYPFRSRLHSLFPWLFITNGIPVASVLAGVWLFVDPYFNTKFQNEYERYFARILESIDWAYHNLTIRVVTDPSLGHINSMITRNTGGKGYRDIVGEIGKCALPVSVMDRAVLNNLTTETDQLKDFRREANSFTSIPFYFFNESGQDNGGPVSFQDLLKKGGS